MQTKQINYSLRSLAILLKICYVYIIDGRLNMVSNVDQHETFHGSPVYDASKDRYTSPKEIEVQSIPTIMVDPHNEVLPFWMEIDNRPAILIHIDNHADMDCGAPEYKKSKYKWLRRLQIKNYANKLHCGSFIAPAINMGIVSEVYWYDPRKNHINVPKDCQTTITNKRVMWANADPNRKDNKPFFNSISSTQASLDIQKSNLAIILDIDLDAFLCTTDYSLDHNSNELHIRLEKTKELIKSIGKRPTIISIARSQTPFTYTPSDRVEEIQNLTIGMLNEALAPPKA